VQHGSIALKVVPERKPGFSAAITILPLFNPPGVSSATAVTIPAGKNETVLPMNASAGAQVRKWKTAVLGTATVGNGPVWVSSQLATIEVTPPFVTFNMERTASEQGKEVELFCKVTHNTPFEGKAKVKLVGLPPKVLAPEVEISKDTKEFGFKLTVDKTSPAGQHKNLFCQLIITQNGEPVVHNVGSAELRIDVPLPPKQEAPKAAPAAVAQKAEAPKPPVQKRLTRLEQLRLEQEDREKEGKGKK